MYFISHTYLHKSNLYFPKKKKKSSEEILLRVDPPENLISKDYRMIWSPLDQDLVVITGGPNNKNIYLASISQVIEHNQNETTLTLDQFYQSPGVTCLEWHKLVSFIFIILFFFKCPTTK